MLKTFTSIATTAMIVATLATTSVQAKQIDAPKCDQTIAQHVAKAQTASPYFWLVLGVGY